MKKPAVTTGTYAEIEVTDEALAREIRKRVKDAGGRKPQVEYRPGATAIALVFKDTGEILVDVAGHRAELDAVAGAKGRFFVHAAAPLNPDEEGDPPEGPPPDLICPC
jgi:hypothetical protein